ncbi:MAG: class I SAM-dependent methyltransferase [Gammaproteobacteria bacterium]|nr:class I SAM-dependent methyltransferase [Gammaproteobacteria bacterium]
MNENQGALSRDSSRGEPRRETSPAVMADLLEPIACEVCESDRQRPLFKVRENRSWWISKCADDPRLDIDHEFSVVECVDCGHAYVSPRLLPEIIDDIYARYWRSHEPATLGRSGYANHVARRIRSLRPCGDLLDFGSGWGVQMREAAEVGWRAVGLEVDRRKVEFCREQQLDAIYADLLDRPFEANSFDAVMAEQVFEHLYRPARYLEEIHRVLRPGGIVYICVPHIDSIAAKLKRGRWSLLHPVSHVQYYDRGSLTRLLERCGFEVATPRYARRYNGSPLKEAAYQAKTFLEGAGIFPTGLALYGRKMLATTFRRRHLKGVAGTKPVDGAIGQSAAARAAEPVVSRQ